MLQQIGGYEIQHEIGRGDVATVYVARQQPVERYVALKVFDRVEAAAADRLRRLAEYLATLDHTGILPIYASGMTAEQVYWVMRYMPAGTLRDKLRVQPLSPEEIDRVVVQIAAVLDHAHERGVFHGDLKPGNILLDHAGNIFVADFGIVQALQATPSAYQAPELRRGEPPDARSDVYSLGAILYELLTASAPPPATPPRPSMLAPEVSGALDAVVLKALAADPADRYQTAGELAEAYAQARAAAEADAMLGVRRIRARRETRPRSAPWIAAALIGLVIVLGGLALWAAQSPTAAPVPTTTPTLTATAATVSAPAVAPAVPTEAPTALPTRARPETPPAINTLSPTPSLTAPVTPTATSRPGFTPTRVIVSPTPTISITAFALLTPRQDTPELLSLTFTTQVRPDDAGPIGTLSMTVPDAEPYVIDRQLAQLGSGEQTLRVSVRIDCNRAPAPLITRAVILTLRAADGQMLREQTVPYVKRWCD